MYSLLFLPSIPIPFSFPRTPSALVKFGLSNYLSTFFFLSPYLLVIFHPYLLIAILLACILFFSVRCHRLSVCLSNITLKEKIMSSLSLLCSCLCVCGLGYITRGDPEMIAECSRRSGYKADTLSYPRVLYNSVSSLGVIPMNLSENRVSVQRIWP